MAIEFFKREEPQARFLAVEKLNLAYNLFTTVLIIIFFNRLNDPQAQLMGRFFIAFGTFAVIYIYTKFPSRATVLLRIVSQMALLSYWYPDTFEFNRIFPNLDHVFAGLVLLFVSFQCGCSGSTTGGIKVDRILIAFKAIGNEINRRIRPHAVSQVRMSGQHLSDSSVHSVMMYIVTYVIVIFISIILVMICGSDATEAVSGVIASLGSVGPGLGDLGSMENYSAEPAMAKFIYAFDMFLGRVEIFPVLVVLSMIFKRR